MTRSPATRVARHEQPAIDEAAMVAARHADRLLAAARSLPSERWERFLQPLPDRLRDDELRALRSTGQRARAAYGPNDSIRDVFPEELTEPFLEAVDRLLKLLARHEMTR